LNYPKGGVLAKVFMEWKEFVLKELEVWVGLLGMMPMGS
jgi:hypothetical protein